MDLFEIVTICKFKEENFGTKSLTNDVLVTVFCETVTIYICVCVCVCVTFSDAID